MGVYLMGVQLIGIYLMGVHLIGEYLMGVHLIDVYFMGVYLFQIQKGFGETSRSPILRTVVDLKGPYWPHLTLSVLR
jgi:hypothetical protein